MTFYDLLWPSIRPLWPSMIKWLLLRPGLISGQPKLIHTEFQGLTQSTPSLIDLKIHAGQREKCVRLSCFTSSPELGYLYNLMTVYSKPYFFDLKMHARQWEKCVRQLFFTSVFWKLIWTNQTKFIALYRIVLSLRNHQQLLEIFTKV